VFIVVRNPVYRLIALAVSAALVLVIYLAVIQPANNTANTALRQGEKQLQQAVQSANRTSGGAVPVGVTNLTNCIAAAGTDTGKIQACQVKFKP
jgi:type II secretory pathway component PulM